MTITKAFLESGRSSKGGYNRLQIEALGVSWKPTHGWLKGLVGKSISDQQAKEFIRHKDHGQLYF